MNLSEVMEKAGLTKSQLARKSGVPQRVVDNVLSGETDITEISALNLRRLSDTLNCTMEYLLGVTPKFVPGKRNKVEYGDQAVYTAISGAYDIEEEMIRYTIRMLCRIDEDTSMFEGLLRHKPCYAVYKTYPNGMKALIRYGLCEKAKTSDETAECVTIKNIGTEIYTQAARLRIIQSKEHKGEGMLTDAINLCKELKKVGIKL